jgi:hypothetical protein
MDYKEHLCHCKKSKYMDIQCPYKRKEDSYFCGIHLKSVQKYIYSEVLHRNILDENGNMILFQKDKNEDEMIEKTYDVDKYTIYGSRDLFFSELFEKHYYLSIYTIRKSIRYLDLRVNTKQSRQYLYQDLKRIYDLEINYKDDIPKIIFDLINKNQSGIFHIASTKKIKWLSFLTNVASIIRAEEKVIIVDNSDWILRPPHDSSLNISKITSLGISTTSFDDALNILRRFIKNERAKK